MERRRSRLSRRAFVVGAAGAGLLAGCGRWPWQGQAQQPVKSARIGWLILTGLGAEHEAFVDALGQFGYVAGQNLVIEYRLAEGNSERLPGFAAELVALPVDLIIVDGGRAALAARQATDSIPIVIGFSAIDPVAEGLVASLARPGGNVTGVTATVRGAELGAKRLELLRDALTGFTRVGVLWDEADPVHVARWDEIRAAGAMLGLDTRSLGVRGPDDVAAALETAANEHIDALVVLHNALTQGKRATIVDGTVRSHLPAMYEYGEWASNGGLMSYGPNRASMYRRAAYYVDRILKGARPADLPVEQPMTFDFVVNLKTAQALGITFPNEIMLQVTEVVP